MESFDISGLALFFATGAMFLRIVPEVIVLWAGIIAVRKRCLLSGIALIVSSAIDILYTGAFIVFSRIVAFSWIGESGLWVMPSVGVLSAILLTAGVLGIALSLPRTPVDSIQEQNFRTTKENQ